MPATTRQMAEIAGVSEQTARNYSRVYAELLSPQARGEIGPRLFSDQDAQIFCSIAAMRRDNVPPAEIITRIKHGDIYIDHTTPHQATTNEPQATQAALEAPHALMLVRSDLQRQINALQRRQDVLLRVAVLWGVLWGAVAALVAGGFVLWLLWLIA